MKKTFMRSLKKMHDYQCRRFFLVVRLAAESLKCSKLEELLFQVMPGKPVKVGVKKIEEQNGCFCVRC